MRSRVFQAAAALVFGILTAELAARIGLAAVDRRIPNGPDAAVQRGEPAQPRDWRADHVPHPYVGFVRDAAQPEVNAMGFYGALPVDAGCESDAVRVAVTGGSFAAQMVAMAPDELATALARALGARVCLSNLAMGGFKQPQQLATLQYFSYLGMDFDLVINVDGQNEVKQGIDNHQLGVNLVYPGLWAFHARAAAGPLVLELVADRSRWRGYAARGGALDGSWSSVAQLVGLLVRRAASARAEEIERQIEERLATLRLQEESPWWVRGGRVWWETEDPMADIAESWRRASEQMYHHQRSRGGSYLHLLQPNQYTDDSKPFSEEEKVTAILDSQRAETLRRGYPELRRAGAALAADAGVPFVDLTGCFAGLEETLWADSCCHLNRRGYVLVAEAIGREVELVVRSGQHAP